MVPSVSVIVPVYNMERFLTKCLDSIINQSLNEIEIILVNDGSQDSSGEILDKYASGDNRIKVIHKKNGGVSSARNVGVAIATGQYIGFVDPDDWISHDMYQKLYTTATKEDLDIVICHNYNHYMEKGYFEKDSFKIEENTLRNIRRHTLKDDYFSAVWNMIFKKSMIDTKNINFPENFTVWEDGYFILKAMYSTDKIKYIDEPCYHYRKPIKKQKYIKNLFYSLLSLHQLREQCVNKWGVNVFNDEDCIEALFCKRVVICLEQELNLNSDANRIQNVKIIMNHPITYLALNNLKKHKHKHKELGLPAFFFLQLTTFKNITLLILINNVFNILRKFKNIFGSNRQKNINNELSDPNFNKQIKI